MLVVKEKLVKKFREIETAPIQRMLRRPRGVVSRDRGQTFHKHAAITLALQAWV